MNKKLLCGIKEQNMLLFMRIFDFLTVIRIPAVFMSILNTRGMRCYYKYRIFTFFAFLLAWIVTFVILILQAMSESIDSSDVIIFGLAGGFFLFIDYYFNKVLRRYLLRLIRREQIHLSKIKGRML